MTEDEARNVITAIVGPVDRPWDTRWQMAWRWSHDRERPALREAGRVLGFATAEDPS